MTWVTIASSERPPPRGPVASVLPFHRLVERAPTCAEDRLEAPEVRGLTRSLVVSGGCRTRGAEVGRSSAGEALDNDQMGEILRRDEAQPGPRKDGGILGTVGEQCRQRVGFARPLAAPAGPVERGGEGALPSTHSAPAAAWVVPPLLLLWRQSRARRALVELSQLLLSGSLAPRRPTSAPRAWHPRLTAIARATRPSSGVSSRSSVRVGARSTRQ